MIVGMNLKDVSTDLKLSLLNHSLPNHHPNSLANLQKAHCPFSPISPENLSHTMTQHNSPHLQNILFFFSPGQEAFYKLKLMWFISSSMS